MRGATEQKAKGIFFLLLTLTVSKDMSIGGEIKVFWRQGKNNNQKKERKIDRKGEEERRNAHLFRVLLR